MAAKMKFVVFAQYLGMLDMMASHFAAAGVGSVTLKGDMAPKTRQAAIATFNHDPSCRMCCASLLAGDVGIDLTGAQAVIHYDRWWNAAKEDPRPASTVSARKVWSLSSKNMTSPTP